MFSRFVRILPSQTGFDGKLKIRALTDLFQDTAALAVQNIYGSTSQLRNKGFSWVLRNYEIKFYGDMPSLDDEIEILTFHDPFHSFYTLRAFKVFSSSLQERRELVSAKSSWLLINLSSGKIVKAVNNIQGIGNIGDDERIEPAFNCIPETGVLRDCGDFRACFHDIDFNGHINNSVYFQRAFDRFYEESGGLRLARVTASFRHGGTLRRGVREFFVIAGGAGRYVCQPKNLKESNKLRERMAEVYIEAGKEFQEER